MKLLKFIKEINGVNLNKFGFEYYEGKNGRWTFKRDKNDVIQYITICKSDFSEGLRLEFYTSIDEYKRIESCALSKDYENVSFFPYNDEESLKNVLKEFNTIIENYGLAALDKLSVYDSNTAIRLNDKMYSKFYNNAEELNKEFIKNYGSKDCDILESVKYIEDVVFETKNKSYEEALETVYMCAAYYADCIIKTFGGVLTLDEEGCCIIKNINGNERLERNPLSDIATYRNAMRAMKDYLYDDFKDFMKEIN